MATVSSVQLLLILLLYTSNCETSSLEVMARGAVSKRSPARKRSSSRDLLQTVVYMYADYQLISVVTPSHLTAKRR